MGENEKTLRWFVDTIDDLEKQRAGIDEKIAALDLAYEALTGAKRAEQGGGF